MKNFFGRLFSGLEYICGLLIKVAPVAWTLILFGGGLSEETTMMRKIGEVFVAHIIAGLLILIGKVISETDMKTSKILVFIAETAVFLVLFQRCGGNL